MTVPQSAPASAPTPLEADAGRRRRELLSFIFLAIVLAPIIAVAFVGSYGLVIWIYQMFNGPPGPGH